MYGTMQKVQKFEQPSVIVTLAWKRLWRTKGRSSMRSGIFEMAITGSSRRRPSCRRASSSSSRRGMSEMFELPKTKSTAGLRSKIFLPRAWATQPPTPKSK